MKLLLIFNPRAANGRAAALLPAIRARLDRAGLQCEVMTTDHAGDGTERVARCDLSAYDGVVAAGGDGTVFEVLNGLYRHPKEGRVPLGLLPVGTGNALSRDFGLAPGDWQAGVEVLQRNRVKWVDVGHVNAVGASYHFLNIVGIGFSVAAGMTAQNLKFLGSRAYTFSTLWHVLKLKSHAFTVELDGVEKRIDGPFVTISNTRFTGTHFKIAPAARFDDGLLDLTMVRALPRRRLLRLFPTVYSGRHVEYAEVTTARAAVVTLKSPEGMPLSPDGEFAGTTPAEIRCLKQDLAMFA